MANTAIELWEESKELNKMKCPNKWFDKFHIMNIFKENHDTLVNILPREKESIIIQEMVYELFPWL